MVMLADEVNHVVANLDSWDFVKISPPISEKEPLQNEIWKGTSPCWANRHFDVCALSVRHSGCFYLPLKIEKIHM
jgi:hypothetical protein